MKLPSNTRVNANAPTGPRPKGKYRGVRALVHIARQLREGLPVVTPLLDEDKEHAARRFFGPAASVCRYSATENPEQELVGYVRHGGIDRPVTVPADIPVHLATLPFFLFPDRPDEVTVREAFPAGIRGAFVKGDIDHMPAGSVVFGYASQADAPGVKPLAFPLYMPAA